MNQIAGVDGFSLMNNLRLVVIVAIFIILIIVLFYNRILGSPKRAKQKDKQVVNPSDDSDREERDAPGAVDDFLGMEESTEKEISKGGESTAESEVEIEGLPAVNYEKIEADLKAVRDEVTAKIETDLKAVGDEVATKVEGLISKVEAVEKGVLDKIEDVIDAKIHEVSNKINDRISEAVRTQINSINSISEERVDSLRKEEVPEEIKEKEQTDTIVLSEGDVGESVGFDIQNVLEEEPVGIPSTEEPKEFVKEKVGSVDEKERDLEAPVKDIDIMERVHLFVRYQLDAFDILPLDESKTVAEEKKESDLEMPPEVETNVKVDEDEPVEAITSTGEIEKKIPAGAVGESVGPARLFFQKFLSVGMKSTEEPKELVEEKVEIKEKKERDLEASVEDRDILEKLAGSLQMDEDSFDVLPSEESKTVAEEKKEGDLEVPSEVKEDVRVDENEPIEAITSTGKVEEKISEGGSVDFDIEKLLEEEPVGMPSTEEPKESVEEKVEFEEKKERDLEAPVEDSDILEKLAGSLQMNEDSFDISPFDESKTVSEEKKERDLEVPSEVGKDVKVDEKEPIEFIASTEEVEEKISEGESDDFDIEKLLEEKPVGIPSTEESGEVVEEKVEFKFKEEKEEGLELPAEETAAHEEIDEKEIDTIAPGDIEKKALEVAKGEEAEEKKQSTIETSDFDIQEFLEELGTPPSGKE